MKVSKFRLTAPVKQVKARVTDCRGNDYVVTRQGSIGLSFEIGKTYAIINHTFYELASAAIERKIQVDSGAYVKAIKVEEMWVSQELPLTAVRDIEVSYFFLKPSVATIRARCEKGIKVEELK